MEILTLEREERLTLKISGEVTAAHANGLGERLMKLCENRNFDKVTIDLSDCQSIVSSGFGALVSFRLSPRISSLPVQIETEDPEILSQLGMLRMERLFDIRGAPKLG